MPRPGNPVPAPARPAPPAQRTTSAAGPAPTSPAQNRSEPQIQLIPAPADGALDAAEEAVDMLLDSGRAPSDVLVLTTGEPHPWAAHELTFGEASYWAQHDAGDDVFYADAAAERASSRPVVVVALNGAADGDARTLPAALAKAGALLLVCGESQRVAAVLGIEV